MISCSNPFPGLGRGPLWRRAAADSRRCGGRAALGGEAQIMVGTHGELQFMDMVTIYGATYIYIYTRIIYIW